MKINKINNHGGKTKTKKTYKQRQRHLKAAKTGCQQETYKQQTKTR